VRPGDDRETNRNRRIRLCAHGKKRQYRFHSI
jgi:hypothetical protein